uniref:Uncharacterized protein n=1 Tax=Anopheles albimanus TaxID=7167 RepID=A0A182FZ68_ANOAL
MSNSKVERGGNSSDAGIGKYGNHYCYLILCSLFHELLFNHAPNFA